MSRVELKNIGKVYPGGVKAVDDVCLTIDDEEFVVLVGPSGCGKSTTLRMIAGLEEISEGELFIDGARMNDVQPKDRNIAMVFQNYALYPHMTVYDNMAFALKIKKFPKDVIDTRVHEAARILDIERYLDRKPKALSGGQRQRVAVGRAIVRQPKVFLFDEPLSNLDAKLRVQMRAEIIALHKRLSATIIYVTHDQVEAMTMGDKIVVMKDGLVQQIGAPLHVYHHPVNKFVAGFIGTPPMNFIEAVLTERGGVPCFGRIKVADEHIDLLKSRVGKKLTAGIRPEDFVCIAPDSAAPGEITGVVDMSEPLGGEINLHLTMEETGVKIIAKMDSEQSPRTGDRIRLNVKNHRIKYFDSDTEKNLVDPD
ncbi:MAG: sn-glycerol-3-phosphate ABC transporter ATP-binding protein UgpC [Synergistaceae bacterium]|jgi:multiple sugar transport system ATP-binding protein|nr:sn-glycerol-3-phosphate ABC transporter ATP-binding protein UgpC [Synergistaceae bacterium]